MLKLALLPGGAGCTTRFVSLLFNGIELFKGQIPVDSKLFLSNSDEIEYQEFNIDEIVKYLVLCASLGNFCAINLVKLLTLYDDIAVFNGPATQTSNGCITCVVCGGNVTRSIL